MNKQEIIVGSRGSLLAVAQAQSVISALKKRFPLHIFSLKKITTLGDTSKNWQPTDVGIFVKELEDALLRNEIDVAIHSVKDLPSCLPQGLALAAIPKREDPRDCIIVKEKTTFGELKKGFVIGTGSLRRRSQLLHIRPDVHIKEIRGNVDTRIKKLLSGEYDAIIVALAGLKRLGYFAKAASFKAGNRIFIHPLPSRIMLPACGQGALGIEARSGDENIGSIVKEINDEKSFLCVQCERSFLREFGAGCRIPLGALAIIKGEQICLEAAVASLDGKKVLRLRRSAKAGEAKSLGKSLAKEVLKNAHPEILEGVKTS